MGIKAEILSCVFMYYTDADHCIAGHQSKWLKTAIILTYAEEKSFLTSQILRNSVIYNDHI